MTMISTRYCWNASTYSRLSPDLRKHLRTRNHRRYKATSITMTHAHANLSKHRWNHMLMDLCYDSHFSQLEAASDRGSGGRRNPKISNTRKRSSTSSERLPNDLRKHQRLPCEYQLIHPYDHRKMSPPISYIYSSFRPLFHGNGNVMAIATAMTTATAIQTTVFIIYKLQLDWWDDGSRYKIGFKVVSLFFFSMDSTLIIRDGRPRSGYGLYSFLTYRSQLGGGFECGTGRRLTWALFVCMGSRRYGLATERSKRGNCCMCTWIMSLSMVWCLVWSWWLYQDMHQNMHQDMHQD
jgi:hypothetical protein